MIYILTVPYIIGAREPSPMGIYPATWAIFSKQFNGELHILESKGILVKII